MAGKAAVAGTSAGGKPATGSAPPTGTPSGGTGTASTPPAGGAKPAQPSPLPRLSSRGSGGGSGSFVDTGAGFILGVLLWVWIGIPFIQGGAKGVKNQLRAKFINKDAKGNWLP